MAMYISNAVITAIFIMSKVSNVRGNTKTDCWKECKEKGRISSFTIAGCEETCDGRGGPLCVIERGETAHAELHFKVGESLHMSEDSDGKEDSVIGLDAPLSPLTSASSWDHILHNVRHKIWWSSPIAYIPFPGGINSNSCINLEVPCDGNDIVQDQIMKWEVPITTWYPKGSYPLYWVIQDTLPNGNVVEIGCTEMTIKII